MIAMLEGPDLLIVAVLVMLLFGAKRLPEFARGLGQAKKEFEQAQRGDTSGPAESIVVTQSAADPTTPLDRDASGSSAPEQRERGL